MEWTDRGIIIGLRKHGETSVILEVMSQNHGRHLGLVRGGRSKRYRPILQIGNGVDLVWRARLEEQLGMFQVEAENLRASELMQQGHALHLAEVLTGHLRLLPEREKHQALFEASELMLEQSGEPLIAGALLVKFELRLLEELGFGLDLTTCAATGAREGLSHVSPKSGRAVCRTAAEPYLDKLLVLPEFVSGDLSNIDAQNIADGLEMTEYFLTRHIFEPRGIEPSSGRELFLKKLIAKT